MMNLLLIKGLKQVPYLILLTLSCHMVIDEKSKDLLSDIDRLAEMHGKAPYMDQLRWGILLSVSLLRKQESSFYDGSPLPDFSRTSFAGMTGA